MKDFRYILKRVIIGVLIALILSFIRYGSIGMVVNATTISTYSMGIHSDNNLRATNSGFRIYTNAYPWANQGDGHLTFSFVLYKNGGGSTDANALIRNVNAIVGSQEYACSIGTTTVGNSTFNNGVYSVDCPVYFDSNGLTGLTFGLSGQGGTSTYTYYFSGLMTFERKESGQTDMTATNNAIGNMHSAINHQTQVEREELQNVNDSVQDVNDSVQDVNNTLNDDDVSDATSDASSFFTGFQSDSHGLSGIITSPLRLIQSLSSSTCSPLNVPLPFVNQNATIPCMSTVYERYPTFLALWQLLTTGMIAYWIIIKIFGHVKGMQDPNDDRIEVLSL